MRAHHHASGLCRSRTPPLIPKTVPRSMPGLLLAIGFRPEEVLGRGSLNQMKFPKEVYTRVPQESFWNRIPDLDLLGEECKRVYRRTAKKVRPDLRANHEAAVVLTQCWQKIKKLLQYHGVRI